MPEKKKRVVICGITGSQGGWVYDALKDDENYDVVVGFSRTSSSSDSAAKKFSRAQIFTADLTNLESLQAVFQGAHYVFGITQPWSADYSTVDVEGEILQGKNIIQACLDCKIQHLVFSSTSHDDVAKTGIPHVDSKIEIENLIASSGLTYTIFHPVQFADNVGRDFFPILANGWIRGFVDADAKVPYVACRDIGLATKAVLEHPNLHDGEIIKLIGDIVSGQELAEIVTKLRGGEQKFQYYAIPRLAMRLFAKEFYAMRVYFEEFGRSAEEQAKATESINRLKLLVPELSSMESHLTREGWATRELISPEDAKKQSEQRKKMAMYTAAIVGAGVAVLFSLQKCRNY